jgi:hypothetical protein
MAMNMTRYKHVLQLSYDCLLCCTHINACLVSKCANDCVVHNSLYPCEISSRLRSRINGNCSYREIIDVNDCSTRRLYVSHDIKSEQCHLLHQGAITTHHNTLRARFTSASPSRFLTNSASSLSAAASSSNRLSSDVSSCCRHNVSTFFITTTSTSLNIV